MARVCVGGGGGGCVGGEGVCVGGRGSVGAEGGVGGELFPTTPHRPGLGKDVQRRQETYLQGTREKKDRQIKNKNGKSA